MKTLLSLFVVAALAPGLMKGYSMPPATQANVDKAVKWVQTDRSHDKEAYKLLEPAAKQGHRAALFMMGFFHYYGRGGVAKDPKAALAPLTKAADLGYPGALRLLGGIYYNADGVKRDLARGYAYMKVADAMGDVMAKKWSRQANDSLSRGDLAAAQAQAKAWVQKHPFQDGAEQKRLLAALSAPDAFKKIAPDKPAVPVKIQ